MKKIIVPILLFTLGQAVIAGDWPRWRGANHDDISIETGLLQTWPSGGPKRLWLSKDIGIGYSTPALAKGKLFILGTKNEKEHLFAKAVKTGETIWAIPLNSVFSNNWGNGPRGAATVDGGNVYALGAKGGLVCANAADGKILWKVDLVDDLGGTAPYWGYSESVLVDGDLVICTPGGGEGTLAALDKNTGKVQWRSGDWKDGAQYSSPVPATINGRRQIVQLTQKTLAGVSALNGKVLWKNAWPGRTAVIPTPIIQGNQIYISSGYGVGCRKITLGSDDSVQEDYSNRNMKNHHGGVLLKGGHLWIFRWSRLDMSKSQDRRGGLGFQKTRQGLHFLRRQPAVLHGRRLRNSGACQRGYQRLERAWSLQTRASDRTSQTGRPNLDAPGCIQWRSVSPRSGTALRVRCKKISSSAFGWF